MNDKSRALGRGLCFIFLSVIPPQDLSDASEGTINLVSRRHNTVRLTDQESSRTNPAFVKKKRAAIRKERVLEDQRTGKKRRPSIARLILCELELIYSHRWGEHLPDDDAGRDDLIVAGVYVIPNGPERS